MLNAHRYNEKTASIERIDFTILGNKEIKNMSVLGKILLVLLYLIYMIIQNLKKVV